MIIQIIIIILLLFISYKLFHDCNINTIQFKNIILHNEICTYKGEIHSKLLNLFDFEDKKQYNILEIGAGNGKSTETFLKELNNKKINYIYSICEYDNNYKKSLDKFKSNGNIKDIYYSKWEDINNNSYDIIFLTSFSTLNENNIESFKKLLTKESYVITLSYFYKKGKLQYFNIISQKNHGLLKLFLLTIK